VPEHEWTTVMLRNIPNRYTAKMLQGLLDSEGYESRYDFLYLPMDFRNHVNNGYAFVNFVDPVTARQATQSFQGFAQWAFQSRKICEVSWSRPQQGLTQHIERYRNSPVMHELMPNEYKPKLFVQGSEVPFPPPTKVIRPPKLRPARSELDEDWGQLVC